MLLAATCAILMLLGRRRSDAAPAAFPGGRWPRGGVLARQGVTRRVRVWVSFHCFVSRRSAIAAGVALLGVLTVPGAWSPAPAPTNARIAAAQRQPAVVSARERRVAASARPQVAMPATISATSVWSTFVQLEAEIADHQEMLAQQQRQLATLTSQDMAPSSAGRPADVIETGSRATALRVLVLQQQTVLGEYHASLREEFQFFVAVAQDAALRDALTVAAIQTPAAAAVNVDLGAVVSELQQQRAATAAASAVPVEAIVRQISLVARPPRFLAPVGGVVSQGFGPTNLAMEPSIMFQGVTYAHFHTGIDIMNVLDSPIAAAAAGQVTFAGSDRDASGHLVGYGNYVVVAHGGGYMTVYGHLDKVLVATGQVVGAGEEIGLLGSSGWSTGPHLHFAIRLKGIFVDPETLLGSAVRP